MPLKEKIVGDATRPLDRSSRCSRLRVSDCLRERRQSVSRARVVPARRSGDPGGDRGRPLEAGAPVLRRKRAHRRGRRRRGSRGRAVESGHHRSNPAARGPAAAGDDDRRPRARVRRSGVDRGGTRLRHGSGVVALEGRCARCVETGTDRRAADCWQAPYENDSRRARVRLDDRVADRRGPPDQEPVASHRLPRRLSSGSDRHDGRSVLRAGLSRGGRAARTRGRGASARIDRAGCSRRSRDDKRRLADPADPRGRFVPTDAER